METKLPHISTPLPGPEAQKILALDKQFVSPSYTRDYPLVAKRGQGAIVEDVDGNLFLDFAAGIAVVSTGHCHPDVVRVDPEAGRDPDPYVGDGFLLPVAGAIGGKNGPDHAGNVPQARGLWQFRRRSHGSGDENCALPHQAPSVYCLSRLVPRADLRRAFAHGQQGGSAARFRPSSVGRRPRAVCQSLSLPARSPRAGLRVRLRLLRPDRTAIVQDGGAARGSSGHRCGADSG